MKRLFRISFNILISSIIPIISWFFLSIIFTHDLANVFSLTYPIQCLSGMIISIFGTGANIVKYKDNDSYSNNNGIFYGTIFSFFIFLIIIINTKTYINFMNMDFNVYNAFCIYSLIEILFNTILQLLLTKLYYMDNEKLANRISLIYNFINFFTLLTLALVTRNQIITITLSLMISLTMIIIYFSRIIGKVNFKFNISHCFKYNSSSFFLNLLFFIIYLFGFKNSFVYGTDYLIAITFSTLVTDTQWDIIDSVKTVAKIDISKKEFNYKEHFKNATKLYLLLILSIIFMSCILYPIYKPNINIVSIFILLQIVDFILSLFTEIKICYLQLEDSAFKITLNIVIAYLIRVILSFIKTPYCTIIAQLTATTYMFIYTKIKFKKEFI